MTEDFIPKIFISYSWTSDEFVVPLAERLRAHGVDVVLDKWDLKEGQDKYEFMEQCVNNPDITKVLIICDKAYKDKADGRRGGVGDETAIISSEIYGKTTQEKFIPIVIEKESENGEACLPTYIKSRIYIDFCDESKYEESYEKLLRSIYNKPLNRKPKLGKKPEWLNDENVSVFPIKDLVRQIRDTNNDTRVKKSIKDFLSRYIETLMEFYDENRTGGEEIYKTFVDMKEVRDIFLDYMEVVPISGKEWGDILTDFFEKAYNTLTSKETFNPNCVSWYEESFEIYRIFLWELFICVTACLLGSEDFAALNRLLTNTYFIDSAYSYIEDGAADYTLFRHYSRIIEDGYKPTTDFKQKFTMLGDCICNQREKKPLYTKASLAEADLFLYQVHNALDIKRNISLISSNYWFPDLYVYAERNKRTCIWSKLKSKRYAQKICELVGAESIEELKKRVEKCGLDRDMRFRGAYDAAPSILSFINPDDIAIIN